jgi:hypothetical protein
MKVISIGAAALVVCSGLAWGQYWGGWEPYYHASTPAESYARGMADVARSAGEYNLATSQAAINATEAQRNYIENRDQWTNTYFQMRAANQKYRNEARGPRPSMEDLVRYAQQGKPQRLSPSELDSVSGKITWPILLQTDRYAKDRDELEWLFQTRAKEGFLTTKDYLRIGELTDAMLAKLKEQVREVPQMDYAAAKQFLKSLAYEGRMPPG